MPSARYDEILISLRRITRAIDLQSRELVRTSGLTVPQFLLLQALEPGRGVSPSVIARKVVLSRATITNILDRLEKSGLVERRPSREDRRSVEVWLTDAGAARLAAAPPLFQSSFLAKFEKLEDWEKSMLAAALARIAVMMDAENLDASPILTAGDIFEDRTEP